MWTVKSYWVNAYYSISMIDLRGDWRAIVSSIDQPFFSSSVIQHTYVWTHGVHTHTDPHINAYISAHPYVNVG